MDERSLQKEEEFIWFVLDTMESRSIPQHQAQAVLEEMRRAADQSLKKYRGHFAWQGDGVNCIFEGRAAADRAVKAGLEILQRLEGLRRRGKLPTDFGVRLCVGQDRSRIHRDLDGRIDLGRIKAPIIDWLSVKHNLEAATDGLENAVVVSSGVHDRLRPPLRDCFWPHLSASHGSWHFMFHWLQDGSPCQPVLNLIAAAADDARKLSVREMARKYRVSETQIVRLLLDVGREMGVVQIIFRPPEDIDLERQLRARFPHLEAATVVKCTSPDRLKEELGSRAAEELRRVMIPAAQAARQLGRPLIFATSCGTTVRETVRALEQDPGGLAHLTIYSLLITMAAQMQEVSPAGIVALLTEAIPNSTGYAVQLPRSRNDLRSAQEAKQKYSEDCNPILDGALDAVCTLTGIGGIGEQGVTHSFNDLVRALGLKDILDRLNAVGEMCYQPITIDGESLMERDELELLRSNLFYATLKQLRQKVEEGRATIFAVAGGLEKHRSILGALRTRAFNRLVTDVESARYVLQNA